MRGEPQIENASAPPCEVTIVAHDIGPVGGMERVLTQLVLGLRGMGHEVTVIARRCELPPGSGVRFRRVRGPSRPFLIAYPWFLLAGSLAVRRHRRGVVQATGAIVLGEVQTISVHYCHQIGVTTASRVTRAHRAYIKLVGALSRAGERLVYGASRRTLFVCVSEGVAEELRRYFPGLSERVLAIQNGVDLEAFKPGAHAEQAAQMRERLGLAAEQPVVAFVGSEWERKGLGEAIRALADAPGWALVVAGGGDRDSYERLARSLGVHERVRWLGVTREVAVVYELADALVFPSNYEAFPLVILEAAAAGTAILTTPVNGVGELLSDGESAILIEREAASIAAALRALSEDPERCRRLALAARAAALGFSWRRMVERQHELLQRLA